MTLRQTAKAPSGDAGSITPGERNTLKSGTVYTLSGDIAEGTVLEIMESGVTVILDGTTSAGTLIEAGAPYDLIVRGMLAADAETASDRQDATARSIARIRLCFMLKSSC